MGCSISQLKPLQQRVQNSTILKKDSSNGTLINPAQHKPKLQRNHNFYGSTRPASKSPVKRRQITLKNGKNRTSSWPIEEFRLSKRINTFKNKSFTLNKYMKRSRTANIRSTNFSFTPSNNQRIIYPTKQKVVKTKQLNNQNILSNNYPKSYQCLPKDNIQSIDLLKPLLEKKKKDLNNKRIQKNEKMLELSKKLSNKQHHSIILNQLIGSPDHHLRYYEPKFQIQTSQHLNEQLRMSQAYKNELTLSSRINFQTGVRVPRKNVEIIKRRMPSFIIGGKGIFQKQDWSPIAKMRPRKNKFDIKNEKMVSKGKDQLLSIKRTDLRPQQQIYLPNKSNSPFNKSRIMLSRYLKKSKSVTSGSTYGFSNMLSTIKRRKEPLFEINSSTSCSSSFSSSSSSDNTDSSSYESSLILEGFIQETVAK